MPPFERPATAPWLASESLCVMRRPGVGLPREFPPSVIRHTTPLSTAEPPLLPSAPSPPPGIRVHHGNILTLAHRMVDQGEDPVALVFVSPPQGPQCPAARRHEEDLLHRTTYHAYADTAAHMNPLELMYLPGGCLLFRSPAYYQPPQPTPCSRFSLAVAHPPLTDRALHHTYHALLAAAEHHRNDHILIPVPNCDCHRPGRWRLLTACCAILMAPDTLPRS